MSPQSNVIFSDVITLSNVNGIPTLEVRLGNADSYRNTLIDVTAHFSYHFTITYKDEKKEQRVVSLTQELHLSNNKKHELGPFVWVLRHVIDEKSSLFGIDFTKCATTTTTTTGGRDGSGKGSQQQHEQQVQIRGFRVTLHATQQSTGATVYHTTGYSLQDVLLGYRFVDQVQIDNIDNITHFVTDYSKLSETVPQPVWYPISIN